MLHDLIQDVSKMIALGAIAVIVAPPVVQRFDRPVEDIFCFFDLRSDPGQIGQFQGGAILLDEMHHRKVMEGQIPVLNVKSLLWKIKGLIDQVEILVFHRAGAGYWIKVMSNGTAIIKNPAPLSEGRTD